MYDRMVDDPRLSYRCPDRRAAAPPCSRAGCAPRSRPRYGVGFGPRSRLNYYRDGHDSVAFHRDREPRELDDTLIAIVTLGARRPFLVRPLGGAHAAARLRARLGRRAGHGRRMPARWEHGVPKVACAGPRVSATWRWAARPAG